jgi:hypothetical protein
MKKKMILPKIVNKRRKEDGRLPMPQWQLHELRRTAKTMMQRGGVRHFRTSDVTLSGDSADHGSERLSASRFSGR